ncbi:MAG: biotin/lipoyl-binding protein [Stellaceae bacterium]
MGAPWTRDGTVRAYVVTMASEVAGRIVELPVADNQFVHKGDLLMVIDPMNYKIAVSLAEPSQHRSHRRAHQAEPLRDPVAGHPLPAQSLDRGIAFAGRAAAVSA